MRDRCVNHNTGSHANDAVLDGLFGSRRDEGIVIDRPKLTRKSKAEDFNDQMCTVLRFGAIVFEVIQNDASEARRNVVS